jgi:hypothetical protein
MLAYRPVLQEKWQEPKGGPFHASFIPGNHRGIHRHVYANVLSPYVMVSFSDAFYSRCRLRMVLRYDGIVFLS